LFFSLAISLTLVKTVPNVKAISSGSMALRPNTVPMLEVYYEDFSFYFEYEISRKQGGRTYVTQYFIRIQPFIIHNGTFYNMKQIVTWLKNNYPNVNYTWLIDKAERAVHYGYNLTRLPGAVADKIDYLGFRLLDLNFPLSWFKLEEVVMIDEGYNITRIHIPKANIVFSFEDLYPHGYSIENVNATHILIGNVTSRPDLIVDPIVFSETKIVITDYTEASPADFNQTWTEDLNGTLQLLAPDVIPSTGYQLSLDTQVRPADSIALRLDFIATNFTRAGAVLINGKDSLGNNQTELLRITTNGTYTTQNSYSSIDANGLDFRSGFYFFKNDYDVSPATGSWQEVDVSAYIPPGSTGVILDLHNKQASGQYVDVRKNGSSDDDYAYSIIFGGSHRYAVVGVDENRVFEVKKSHANVKIWLAGYCDGKVQLFTNKTDYSTATTGSWANVNVSSSVPDDATGVIVKMINTHNVANLIGNVRKRGSTDDRWNNEADIFRESWIHLLVGVDDEKVFQQYIEATMVDLYLVGYTLPPVTFFTNARDATPSSALGWFDVDLTSETEASAYGAILDLVNPHTSTVQVELREKTSTDNRIADADLILRSHIGGLVGLDASNVFQGYVQSTSSRMWLMGYTTGSGNYTLEVTQPRWGLVWKQGDNQYQLDVGLEIGDGTDATYFADENVQVVFSSDVASVLLVQSNSTFRLGRMVNATEKLSERGCHLKTQSNTATINVQGSMEIYSSLLTAEGTRLRIFNYGISYGGQDSHMTMWATVLHDVDIQVNSDADSTTDIYRVTAHSGTTAFFPVSGIASYNDVLIHSYTNVFRAQLSTDVTFKNVVARNNTRIFSNTFYTGDFFIINGDSDTWAILWSGGGTGELYRQYEFDLTITYMNVTVSQDANVTISNAYLGTSDSWLTFANGSIPTQTYNYGHYNKTQTGIYDYNPYNITVTREGYQTYTTLFNVTKKEELTIALQDADAADSAFPTTWLMAGSAAGLITGCLVALVWFHQKRKEDEREDFILTPRKP